jgi:hypothetical protein
MSEPPPQTVLVGGMTVNWHPCLLAEVSPHDGPDPAGTTMDVKRYNDLAHKNIAIDDPTFTSSFSAFGVVAGTSHLMGVRSLILDRSRMRRDARVFIYSEDPDTMQSWIELVDKGTLSGVVELPWRRPAQDGKESDDGDCDSAMPKGCTVTLLEPAKLSVDCGDGRCMIIDAPQRTRIWTGCAPRAAEKPKVSVGRAYGKKVLFFDGDWGDSLELPMLLTGGQFMALAIGV